MHCFQFLLRHTVTQFGQLVQLFEDESSRLQQGVHKQGQSDVCSVSSNTISRNVQHDSLEQTGGVERLHSYNRVLIVLVPQAVLLLDRLRRLQTNL